MAKEKKRITKIRPAKSAPDPPQGHPKSAPRPAKRFLRVFKVPKSGPRMAKSAPRGHQQARKSLRKIIFSTVWGLMLE